MKFIRQFVEFVCWLWLLATTPPDHPEQPDPDMNKKLKSLLEMTWLKWLWSMKVEVLLFAMAIGLFFGAMPWLRAADSTAAGLDAGVLTFFIVGVFAVIAALILFFVIVRAVLPYWDKWFDGELKDQYSPEFRIEMEKDWREAGPVPRLYVFFGLMAAVILGVCIVTAAAF